MKGRLSKLAVYSGIAAAWLLGIGACTTTEMKPAPLPTISPPDYVKVPQPGGFDMADLSTIFLDPTALSPEAIKTCDADYLKLRKITLSEDEIRQGVRELVKQDPIHYHWCFYGKILELETALRNLSYIDEKQKKVLDTYMFLVPVARSYLKEYRDSRYLRWAVRRYRHLSEWVFYRKVDQTPQMTQELVEAANPFGLWREPVAQGSVLEKYHLGKAPQASPSPAPETSPAAAPAQAAAPSPAPAAAAPPAEEPSREPASNSASAPEVEKTDATAPAAAPAAPSAAAEAPAPPPDLVP